MRHAWITGLVLLVPSSAAAHLLLTSPPPRTMEFSQEYPCGGAPPTGHPTVYAGGETIEIRAEFLPHDSTYRIAISPAGDMGFEDNIIAQGLPEQPEGNFLLHATLPDIDCASCTLQVIQVHVPDDPTHNYNWFSCADIEIRSDAPVPDAGPLPEPSDAAADVIDASTEHESDARAWSPPDASRPTTLLRGGCHVGGRGTAYPLGAALLAATLMYARRRGRDGHSATR